MYRILILSHYLKLHMRFDPALKKSKYNQLTSYIYKNIYQCMLFSTSTQKLLKTLPELPEKQQNFQIFQDLLGNINFANITNEEAEQFLSKCGNTANISKKSKNEICQNIYKNLQKHDKVNLKILNAYINVCTENNVKLNIKELLRNIECKVTGETYKLLLKNCCEQGDIEEALGLLDIMKLESVPLDEFVFNNLVLAYSSSGGLSATELILNTMRAAQLNISNDTKFCILKGLSRYSCHDDFRKSMKTYSFKMNEYQLIEIINELGLYNLYWLPEIEDLYGESTLSNEFKYLLQQQCINLIHIDKPDAAFYIFKYLLKLFPEEDGFFILEAMLYCNYDSKNIKTYLKGLQDIGNNEYLTERLIELALKTEKTDISWSLFEMLPELRPHYFWPLLIFAYKKEGEIGIFQAVSDMRKMNVQIDFETWAYYILPYCNMDDCKILIKKFQNYGFSVKELFSPLLSVLIKSDKLKLALDLCDHYNVKIFGDSVLNLLPRAWYTTRDSLCVVSILQKYCESNNNTSDFVGEFLTCTLKLCIVSNDFQDFHNMLKVIDEKSLKILALSAENLKAMLKLKTTLSPDLSDKIEDELNRILNFGMKSDVSFIPHPKDMSLEELECHLLELTEKNMNTRGILRKLILLNSSLGNIKRVKELRQQFLEEKYEESIGMKSSIFYEFIKAEEIEASLEMYKEIKENKSNFSLDDFKVIDLCTLLINNDRVPEAWTIIKEEAKIRRKSKLEGIRRNCFELLNAFKNEDQQMEMFTFLVNNGYCKPENIILGPLVRIHLKKGNLENACDSYIKIAQKYKSTPLQVELLKEILLNQNEKLLDKVLKCTALVHSNAATQTGLVAAAAECGKSSVLAKILSRNAIPINHHLKQRCDRWITEGKTKALMTLLSACYRIDKNFRDADYIINGLLKIYKLNNDMEALSRLYNYLIDNEIETLAAKEIHKVIEDMQQKSK